MPLHEYECEACGHRFELIQKFSDPPAETCPKCGGRVRKLISAPGFHFKGSGWYITDYARAGGKDTGKDADKDTKGTKDAKDAKESTAKTDTDSKTEKKDTPAKDTTASKTSDTKKD